MVTHPFLVSAAPLPLPFPPSGAGESRNRSLDLDLRLDLERDRRLIKEKIFVGFGSLKMQNRPVVMPTVLFNWL